MINYIYLTITTLNCKGEMLMNRLSIKNNFILINARRDNYKIPIQDILYIENEQHTLNICTADDTYYCYERMDIIEKQLARFGFLRCHQNYLVQKECIVCFDNHTLQLKGTDFTVPVSRKCQKAIRNVMMEYGECGFLVCEKGLLAGYIVKIEPEQPVMIGRDGNVADVIIQLPLVSRLHCKLIYHYETDEYEITDYSTNGTFIHGQIRLIPKHSYILEADSEVCFGDRTNIFKVL